MRAENMEEELPFFLDTQGVSVPAVGSGDGTKTSEETSTNTVGEITLWPRKGKEMRLSKKQRNT